jgi:rhomboid family GlyGly-CTERM serine protease
MTTPRCFDFPIARVPWATFGFAAAVLVVGLSRSWSAALELNRDPLAHGAWWCVFTAHFTHWNTEHLAWDLAAFLVCGGFIERQTRAVLIATIAASAVLVSVAVLVLAPEIEIYRGLSGVDAALFTVVAVELMRRAHAARSPLACAMAATAALGLSGKTILDLTLAHSLFIDAHGTFVSVPVAHVAGIVAGLAVSVAVVVHAARRPAADDTLATAREGAVHRGNGRTAPLSECLRANPSGARRKRPGLCAVSRGRRRS